MNLRSFFHLASGLLLALSAAVAHADDIDIYYNQNANTLQPPATVIVLDLNLLGICDNVLTNAGSSTTTYGGSNPLGQTACFNLRTQTLTAFLTSIGRNPTTVLTSALMLLGPSGLCQLYTQLGLTSPTVGSGLLGLGAITTLSCATLATIGGLVSNIVSSNFLNALIGGLLNPLLSTTLAALPAAVAGAVNSTIGGIGTILADPLSISNLLAVIGDILNNLINSRVAIMVMHNNRGSLTGSPATYPAADGNAYACQFADVTYGSTIGTTARNTNANTCSNGAYFLFGFRNLVDQGTLATLLSDVRNKINALLNPVTVTNALTGFAGAALTSGNLTPPLQGKEAYNEILHYLYGDSVYNGALSRYDGLFSLLTRDTTIESGGNYVAPQLSCRIVNVLNVDVSDTRAAVDSDSDTDAVARYFPGLTLRLPATATDPDPGFSNLVTAAQTTGVTRNGNRINLNSYFVVQDNLSSLTALSNLGANVLNYANATGLLGLGQSIAQFMRPVLITDASLQTTSVAASPTSTTGLLDSAFVPEFRPKDSRKPTWDGNVKRLQLVRDATTGRYSLVDASGAGAIAADGRISTTARTLWTDTARIGGATADGRLTTLGGAGQNIPGYVFNGGGNPGRVNNDGRRQLYYDQFSTTGVPSRGNLDADTQAVRNDLTADLAGAASDSERRALLLYARGYDVGTTTAPKGTGTDLANLSGRPWLLGAVLHSRPVAVNYGARSGFTRANPDIRVLFGSADGLMHSVRNGTAASPSGAETWAFMPRATMRFLRTLRNDTYAPDFPYGVDGAPSILLIDRNSTGGPADGVIDSGNANDHAYAFFGLRRGGSNYYGLDITNPDSPTLMWRIGTDGLYSANIASPGLASGSGGTNGWFTELGQTFSTPAVGRMRLPNASGTIVDRSVLLFGGGYNGGFDSSGNRIGKDLHNSRNATASAQVGTNETRGNALYIVDAVTGELIWKAARSTGTSAAYDSTSLTFRHPLFQDSIPSDVTAVDSDGDGYTDRLYVGDTGGRVWRADFPGTDRSQWTAGPIASLGRSHGSTADTTIANDRRFFHAPDFVPARGQITTTTGTTTTTSTQNFDVVVIGSGDREDPFNTTTTNWLYAIRDRDISSGKSLTDTTTSEGVITDESDSRLYKQSDLTDLTTSCASSTTAPCAAGAGLSKGWRLQLTGSGEKTVSAPVTINNTVTLSTFVPPANDASRCTPDEGSGRVYGINLIDSRPFLRQFINDSDGNARTGAALTPGLSGEVTALTPQVLGINTDTLQVSPPLIYRTFWRERREEEPERVRQ